MQADNFSNVGNPISNVAWARAQGHVTIFTVFAEASETEHVLAGTYRLGSHIPGWAGGKKPSFKTKEAPSLTTHSSHARNMAL